MAEMNAESIQQRIQIARRDAEALKDRIKKKKDELADTTRKSLERASESRVSVDGHRRPWRVSLAVH